LRLLLIIPIAYLIKINTPAANVWVIVLAVLAASTDFLDGYISRRRGEVTDLGKIIDPLADKICLGVGLIVLVLYRGFPVPLALLLIYRDIMIILLGWFSFKKIGHPTPANFWGKLNTTVIAVTAILFLMNSPEWLNRIFLSLSYFTIFASGLSYAILGQKILCPEWKQKTLYWTVLGLLTILVVVFTINFRFI